MKKYQKYREMYNKYVPGKMTAFGFDTSLGNCKTDGHCMHNELLTGKIYCCRCDEKNETRQITEPIVIGSLSPVDDAMGTCERMVKCLVCGEFYSRKTQVGECPHSKVESDIELWVR